MFMLVEQGIKHPVAGPWHCCHWLHNKLSNKGYQTYNKQTKSKTLVCLNNVCYSFLQNLITDN